MNDKLRTILLDEIKEILNDEQLIEIDQLFDSIEDDEIIKTTDIDDVIAGFRVSDILQEIGERKIISYIKKNSENFDTSDLEDILQLDHGDIIYGMFYYDVIEKVNQIADEGKLYNLLNYIEKYEI